MADIPYRVHQALGVDLLDWCHRTQPDDAQLLAVVGPKLRLAGLDLPEAETLDLVAQLLDADEPPLPQAPAPRPVRPAPSPAPPRLRHAVHDDACRALVAQVPNTIVPWLLMAGYAYHHLDHPILTDTAWDALCRDAVRRWDIVTHPHKRLITVADLDCGSLYALPRTAYPAITVSAVERIIREGVVMTVVTTLGPEGPSFGALRHVFPVSDRQPGSIHRPSPEVLRF